MSDPFEDGPSPYSWFEDIDWNYRPTKWEEDQQQVCILCERDDMDHYRHVWVSATELEDS